MIDDNALLDLVRKFHDKDKLIAAICAGTALLTQAGILENVNFSSSLSPEEEDVQHIHDWEFKQVDDITVDGKFITAIGSAYVEFASRGITELNLYETGEEDATFAYFKNQMR